MKTARRRTIVRTVAVALPALAVLGTVGCVRVSGETWYVHSAATPEGWPDLTPVGEVQVKTYPAYRAATVEDAALDEDGMRPMFMALFRHIQANEIAMTAPVDMGYRDDDSTGQMASMAFLYRDQELGQVGDEGAVRVRDFESRAFASVGVRGDYTSANYEKGLALLETWLQANGDGVEPTGPPRYLGYNGPFVPSFMRYGEVQVPVTQRD